MKICLAQLAVTPTKAENLRKVTSVLDDLEDGTKLVVFPEYVMGFPKGGLNRKFIREAAEPIDGSFVREVASAIRNKGASVVLPVFELSGGRVYNTAVVISRGKVAGGYRKVKLFDALGYRESTVFGTGKELVTFRVGKMIAGVVICYDIRFPELTKGLALGGAHVLLAPSAWYRGPLKEEQWQTLLVARAHENTCYAVGVGNANDAFVGRSTVVDPAGVKIMDLGAGERVGYCDLDLAAVEAARERLPVLRQSGGAALRTRRLKTQV
jgi:predicted amidohydrolase